MAMKFHVVTCIVASYKYAKGGPRYYVGSTFRLSTFWVFNFWMISTCKLQIYSWPLKMDEIVSRDRTRLDPFPYDVIYLISFSKPSNAFANPCSLRSRTSKEGWIFSLSFRFILYFPILDVLQTLSLRQAVLKCLAKLQGGSDEQVSIIVPCYCYFSFVISFLLSFFFSKW